MTYLSKLNKTDTVNLNRHTANDGVGMTKCSIKPGLHTDNRKVVACLHETKTCKITKMEGKTVF